MIEDTRKIKILKKISYFMDRHFEKSRFDFLRRLTFYFWLRKHEAIYIHYCFYNKYVPAKFDIFFRMKEEGRAE